MNQHYGVLRVVRVRLPTNATANLQERYPSGWLPEERLVHLLTRTEATIGQALSNDVVLMDPTVSRIHARITFDASGWQITNLTAQNIVRVNGRAVASGSSMALQPQDIIILGSTMLQLIAPQADAPTALSPSPLDVVTERLPTFKPAGRANGYDDFFRDTSRKEEDRGVYDGSEHLMRPQLRKAIEKQEEHQEVTPLPLQPAPELEAQPWNAEEEHVFGAGVTMQFALPQRLGLRTRWLIAGIGVAILVLSAVITLIINGLIGISALTQFGVSNFLAAIVIPAIPALCIILLVNFMDRFEREPWFLRLAAFLWGAVIAIPPALFIETSIDAAIQHIPNASDVMRSALDGLNAGVTEETIKGLGLLLLFFILRDEFDNVTDGIVYGALIGAGFAMVENFRYFAVDFGQFPVFLIVYRIVLGWLGHSTFTVCFGAALGYVRHTKIRWRQIAVPLLGYLLAVGLHSFFDFVDFQASIALNTSPANGSITFLSLLALIGDYIPPFLAQIFLLYLLIKALAHEAAVIREFLANEVSNGVVQVDEYALLQNSFQRTKAERHVLRQYGIRQWLRVKALYQTEIGLAFRKWHVSMGDKPKLGYLQPEDAYRRRIKRLRHEISAQVKNQ